MPMPIPPRLPPTIFKLPVSPPFFLPGSRLLAPYNPTLLLITLLDSSTTPLPTPPTMAPLALSFPLAPTVKLRRPGR